MTAYEDELLFVTGKDIRDFFFAGEAGTVQPPK